MTYAEVISLFPSGANIGVGITDPCQPSGVSFPEEEALIARAVPKRVNEFRAGRSAARQALKNVGRPPAAIPARDDRLPQWPDGVAGSISHCGDLCVAVVSDTVRSVGIDVEPVTALPVDLWDEILLPEERFAVCGADNPGLMAKLVFSAKEAAYKAQYPLSETLFGFDGLCVSWTENGTFTAAFRSVAGPFDTSDNLTGRFMMNGAHVVTAVTVR